MNSLIDLQSPAFTNMVTTRTFTNVRSDNLDIRSYKLWMSFCVLESRKVSSRIIDKVELFSILRKRIGLNEKGIGRVLLIFESILLNLFFQVPSKILSWLQWKVSHTTISSVACYTFHWNGCPQFRLPQLLHFRLKILLAKNWSFH